MQIPDRFPDALAHRSKDRTFVVPQKIRRTEDDARDGNGTIDPMRVERAQEDQELADEPVRAGKTYGGQSDQQEERREQRRVFGHSAECRQLRGLLPALEEARDEEQSGGAEPEIDHREKATLKALVVQREQADHDETQVADAAVGQETPEVRLNQR